MPNPQPRDTAPAQEPRWTLYPEEWRAARERVALLRSARDRRLFFALLSYLERGWEIIRPLHVAANRIVCVVGPGGRTAEDVTAFIECDPLDVCRGITHSCMRAIPEASQGPSQAGLDIVADEAGDVARYLRILALGADHPDFPPELRGIVRTAATAMTRWHAGLAEVLEPAEACAWTPGESPPPGCASARPTRHRRGARAAPQRQAAASAGRATPLYSLPSSRNE